MIFENEIQKCLEVLRAGGTILYPTDTIWGLGCDATNREAVDKIFKIKDREGSKNLISLVSDEGMLNRFVKEVPAQAWELIEVSTTEENDERQRPLTIIYDSGRGFAPNVVADDGSVAVRLTRDEFCQRLIHKFGKPVVSTSANKSGDPPPKNFSEISEALKRTVDHVVAWRQHENSTSPPSSIIKLRGNGEVKIVRK